MMQNHSAHPGATATQTTRRRAATRPGGIGGAIARCLAVLALAGVGAGAVALGAGVARGALDLDNGFIDFPGISGLPQHVQMNYGDNLMIRDSYGNDSIVEKDGSVWRMGFAKDVSGGFIFGGYANNDNNNSNTFSGYEGWCEGFLYDSVFANGEPVDRVYIVHDRSGDGIGEVISGSWKLGSDDTLYPTSKIEFNGVMGDVTKIPVPDYMGSTLILPHTVVVPEPMTVGLMAVGALAVLARKRAARSAVRAAGKKP